VRAASARRASVDGFTLLEVLIAMVVVAVGLLGLAKMQATALASSQVNGVRALVAFQTNSYAAAMHANRAYWASGSASLNFSMQGTTVTDASGVLNATPPNCSAATLPAGPVCSPAQLAAFDAQAWAANMNALFPTYQATGTCSTPLSGSVSCTFTVNWLERFVSSGSTAASDSDATGGERSFTVYIEP